MTNVRLSFHDGVLKRYSVALRCTSHRKLWSPEGGVVVFATSIEGAKAAAIEKMKDKYLRHKKTRWVVTGEPSEC